MDTKWKSVGNGHLEGYSVTPDIDPEKLTIKLAESLKELPKPEDLLFGTTFTDHMLVVEFSPETGWSAPEIKPYASLTIDPASSCLQYATNIFEGMKAYLGPDGKPRLFRPDKNMARISLSAARVALPPFNESALLTLLKKLVLLESRWIPQGHGYSLYVRPTMLGTRAALGVAASDHAILYCICSPTGPYFRDPKPVKLLAVSETVRSWPGGTGGHKLGLNYSPGFPALRLAAKNGYDQILWLLPTEAGQMKVTEAGAMNFFIVVKRDDGDFDVITPPLDGTILPGVTRASCLALLQGHTDQKLVLPNIPPSTKMHIHECTLTMEDIASYSREGKLVEAFGVGTAVLVVAIGSIGFLGKDFQLPSYKTILGPVGQALYQRILEIQEGRVQWDNWSVVCE